MERVLDNERINLLAVKIKMIKEKTPREFEVLRLITELCLQNRVITTGMLRDNIRRKGLAVSGRMLDYYLNHLREEGLIALKEKRERGLTREIRLCVPTHLIEPVQTYFNQ